MKKWEQTIIISDHHFPFQDNDVINLVSNFLEEQQPKEIIINGDLIDFWEISKFNKNPPEEKAFQDDLDLTVNYLYDLRSRCPKSKIIYIEGNHEFRMRRYLISQAPEIRGLRCLRIEELLHLNELKIQYISVGNELGKFIDNYIKKGKLYIGHFDQYNKYSGYTAKNLIFGKGCSIIQGHTHRFAIVSHTLMDGTELIGVESGCLCNRKPKYVKDPDWQFGFVILYTKKNSLRFQIIPIRIVNYGFFFGGKEYKIKKEGKN